MTGRANTGRKRTRPVRAPMVGKTPRPLSARQHRFVAEYLKDLHATKAALRAGYSKRSAAMQGSRLLQKDEIQAAIAASKEAAQDATGVTAERVLAELALVGFSDIGDVLDFTGDTVRLKPAREITARARRTISSVKVKRQVEGRGDEAHEVEVIEFKLWNKDSALEKLGKYLGIFADDPIDPRVPTGPRPIIWVFESGQVPELPPPPVIDVTPTHQGNGTHGVPTEGAA